MDAGVSLESVAFTVTVVRRGGACAELLWARTAQQNIENKKINSKRPLSRERRQAVAHRLATLVFSLVGERTFIVTRILKVK